MATDIQNTMTHEMGHAMGLDHVAEPLSTMEATAPMGETQKRIIDVGTAAGFCDAYPRGPAAHPVRRSSRTSSKNLSGQNAARGARRLRARCCPGVLLSAWMVLGPRQGPRGRVALRRAVVRGRA